MKVSLAVRVFAILMLVVALSVGTVSWMGSEEFRAENERSVAREMSVMAGVARFAILTADENKRQMLLDGLDDFGGVSASLVSQENFPQGKLVSSSFKEEARWRLGKDVVLKETVDGSGVIFGFPLDDEFLAVKVEFPYHTPPQFDFVWFAIMLLISGVCAWFSARGVTRPVSRLAKSMRRFADGERGGELGSGSSVSEVDELEREFVAMQSKLEESERNRDVVLAGISHDMRTPLSRIMLLAEFADEDTRNSIVEEVEGLDAMLKGFMDFVRVGNTEERKDYSPKEVALRAIEMATPSGQTPIFDCSDVPLQDSGYPQELMRAISNVVANAWKYGASPVSCRLVFVDGEYEFDVQDGGAGFGSEPERLLKPFERGNASRSNVDGSGLGLSIVDRVMRRHGGKVSFPTGGKTGAIRLSWKSHEASQGSVST